MDAQKNLQKNLDTFWSFAKLNLESTQKALELAQKESKDRLEHAFSLVEKAQTVEDFDAAKALIAQVSNEQKTALENLASTSVGLAQDYAKATQKEAQKYFQI